MYYSKDYFNTLAPHIRMSDEMLETFPDFRQNPYYNQAVNEYEQKLINIHLKSTLAFLVIYRLKMLSKKIKEMKKNMSKNTNDKAMEKLYNLAIKALKDK